MSKRIVVAAATLVAAASLAVPAASASPHMLVGIYDEAQTLYGNPDKTFPVLKQLRTQVLRVNLYWGGTIGVARRRPANPTNPADPAYDWSAYDRTVNYAAQYGIKVVFSIYGTPPWANGVQGLYVAPKKPADLQKFAFAAAKRYSGTFEGEDGRLLPPVRYWLAWNEPNNPAFLRPQFKRAGGRWIMQSPLDYAKICTAVYKGVHQTQISSEKVGCGTTAPRGNNNPNTGRPSVSPLPFLRGMKQGGAIFDVYAHHPYASRPTETPSTPPAKGTRGQEPTAITLGNLSVLTKELTRLYGPKKIWITEYGYQTNPPDRIFGVTWAKQAAYLKQAYAIARRNPRIDMMLWFLLRDEGRLGASIDEGWQSGFYTVSGRKKPSFNAFMNLPH